MYKPGRAACLDWSMHENMQIIKKIMELFMKKTVLALILISGILSPLFSEDAGYCF